MEEEAINALRDEEEHAFEDLHHHEEDERHHMEEQIAMRKSRSHLKHHSHVALATVKTKAAPGPASTPDAAKSEPSTAAAPSEASASPAAANATATAAAAAAGDAKAAAIVTPAAATASASVAPDTTADTAAADEDEDDGVPHEIKEYEASSSYAGVIALTFGGGHTDHWNLSIFAQTFLTLAQVVALVGVVTAVTMPRCTTNDDCFGGSFCDKRGTRYGVNGRCKPCSLGAKRLVKSAEMGDKTCVGLSAALHFCGQLNETRREYHEMMWENADLYRFRPESEPGGMHDHGTNGIVVTAIAGLEGDELEYAGSTCALAMFCHEPVENLQNTFSDRTRCIAQHGPGSSSMRSALQFHDRMYFNKAGISAADGGTIFFCLIVMSLFLWDENKDASTTTQVRYL